MNILSMLGPLAAAAPGLMGQQAGAPEQGKAKGVDLSPFIMAMMAKAEKKAAPPAPMPGLTDGGTAPNLMAGPLGAQPMADVMPQTPTIEKPRGPLGRIKDFVGSDRGKGALLRAGAAMLSTGDVGRGIMTGAGYVDDQKALEAGAARDQRDYALKERLGDAEILDRAAGRQIDREGLFLDQLKLMEAIRKAKAGEQLDASELAALQQWRYLQNETTQRGQDINASVQMRGQDVRSADSRYNTNLGYYRDNGSGAEETTYQYDEDGEKIGQTTTKSGGARLPIVTNQAEYDALPVGASYLGPDGRQFQKR